MELQSNWNVPPHELIVADDDHDMDGRSVILLSAPYTHARGGIWTCTTTL